MNERNGWAVRAAATAMAALALAGCSATHVGDDWQCPLAQGEVCSSVAAADPAVPKTRVPGTRVPETLVPGTLVPKAGAGGTQTPAAKAALYRPRGEPAAASGRAAQRDCESDCGPLAWLAGLLEGFAGEDTEGEETAVTGEGAAGEEHSGPTDAGREPVAPAAALQAAPGDASISSPPADEAAAGENFREPEEIARIWIAPFVDAEGIYHEGVWVRAVIAPAEWRLP